MSEGGAAGLRERHFRLGLIVNPVAGIGGSVALKGSDGRAIVAAARARGAELRAPARARRALGVLEPLRDRIAIHTCGDAMGEQAAREAGFAIASIVHRSGAETTAEDTRAAALAMAALPVDLLLFAGGDGTARDICSVIGTRIPALGIPAGVKMHSAVYAVSPEAAGEITRGLISGELTEIAEAEVRDLDEDAFRQGRVVARHFGELQVPVESRYVQRVKAASEVTEEQLLLDIAAEVVEGMQSDCLYLLGPGTTTAAIKGQLGIAGTLLGVDAVRDGRCVLQDATERQLLEALEAHSGCARIIVTAIGGQGHIFGRGNQQISARVIRRVGIEGILVVAAPGKIRALDRRPLLVDTNDVELDRELHRFVRVVTGYRQSILYPVGYDARADAAS